MSPAKLASLVLAGAVLVPVTRARFQDDEPSPKRPNPVVRFAVAHLHGATRCYGYLYFSRDRIRYQAVRPLAVKHSFAWPRAELKEAKASESETLMLVRDGKPQEFVALPAAKVDLGRHQPADVLPVRSMALAAAEFEKVMAMGDKPGEVKTDGTTQKIVTDPGGVEVVIDGVVWGTTDLDSGEIVLRGIPFGNREFMLRRRGYKPMSWSNRYEYEQTGEIYAPLTAAEKMAAGLSLQDVLDLLEGGVAPRRVAQLVQKHGVTFSLTPDREQALRSAGGVDELMEAIAKAKK
ncbi:MAG TPA: hypothetical protein VNK82_13095 [Terriglobales bacterium]|nr:hypothetical protein [Terriglobales bacterium]